MDAIGYDAVDIGPLAQSWRCEPRTPVYVWPYVQHPPENMSDDQARRWFVDSPNVAVSADQVNDLIHRAERVHPIGGFFASAPPGSGSIK